MTSGALPTEHGMIRVRLQLQLIRLDHDFKLTLVKDHADTVASHIDNLTCFTAILALSYTNHVARLEILGDECNVNLERVEVREINRLESDKATFNLNDCSTHASVLTLMYADLIAFHVNGLAAL